MYNFKKACAAIAAVAVSAGTLAAFPDSSVQQLSAETAYVTNDFDTEYEGWCNVGDLTKLTADEQNPHNGTRSMCVSNRLTPEDGASSAKGLWLWGGRNYNYSVFVKHSSGNLENFRLSMSYLLADGETWEDTVIAEGSASSGQWTELKGKFRAPEGASEFIVKITTDSTCDFWFDDFTVEGKKYSSSNVSAAGSGLKDEFANYFRVGNILNGGTVKNSTITAEYLKDFNSIECENETKPDATLVKNGSTDTNINVSLNSCAAIADWCSKNGMGFRGHTLVWHSQTPQWFFKQGFNDSGAWVSKDVMNQRLESYIKNMFNAFKTQYPNLNVYAYDVANECMNDSNGGPRTGGYGNGASPWTQIYGDNSFIEQAFRIARKYAPEGCDLYYNDYNEYMANGKKQAIMALAKDLYGKGLLDGVGMQSHVPANATGFAGTVDYLKAMDDYLAIGCDVQVTELDISLENGKYSLQDQATKYKAIYQHAVDHNKANKAGQGKVTLVQVWGPNDANSWLKAGSNALLFDSNHQPKLAYNELIKLLPQSEWGDGNNPVYGGGGEPPKPLEPDKNGYYYHYDMESDLSAFEARGGCTIGPSGRFPYKGSEALVISERSDAWNGAQLPLSTTTFVPGSEYSFSACYAELDGPDACEFKMTLQYDLNGETNYDMVAQTSANNGEYVQLANTNYRIPEGASNLTLVFETTEETCNFYIDEVIIATAGTKIDGPVSVVVPTTKIKGDLDFDSRISVADLVLLKSGLVEGFKNKTAQTNGDVDQSTATDAADALYLQQYLLGAISEFPDNTPPEPEKKPMRTISEYTPTVKVSEFETADSKQEKAGVQYGTVKAGTYYSTTCNRNKPYNILLPANYSTDKQYPVLYVMHGYWENQDRMIIKGNGTMYTRQIIGNAIADGSAEDMIVVFPYIYSSATQENCSAMDNANNAAYDNFINDLTKDLMPHIEKTYSVKTGRENTAITGFSMGGRESLLIGMKRPDLFGYVGAICPAPGVTGAFKWNSEEEAPSLLFITAGSNDTVVYSNPENYHNNFTKNGVPHIWHYVNGGYHGDNSIHAHIYNFVRAVFKA